MGVCWHKLYQDQVYFIMATLEYSREHTDDTPQHTDTQHTPTTTHWATETLTDPHPHLHSTDPCLPSLEDQAQNQIQGITLQQECATLRMKVRTLEIEVNVQKDSIIRMEDERHKLTTELLNANAKMHLTTTSDSIKDQPPSNEPRLTQQISRQQSELNKLKTIRSDPLPSQNHSIDSNFQSEIMNLRMEVQRLAQLNAGIEHNNQMLRGEIGRVSEYNHGLAQENSVLKHAVSYYSQERTQLYHRIESMKELQNNTHSLQISNRNTKSPDPKASWERERECSQNQRTKKELGSSEFTSNLKFISIPQKPVPLVQQKVTTFKGSQAATPKQISIHLNSMEQVKWVTLQSKIEALKSQNQELMRGVLTR